MIETTLGKARQFATHGTQLFDEAESLRKDYNEQGGQAAILAYFSRSEVAAGLGTKTPAEATAEVVAVIVTAIRFTEVRDNENHGANLAPLR